MRLPWAKQGLPYILGLAAATLLSYFIHYSIAVLFFILTLFVMYFFRDPQRQIVNDENTFLSPSDGVVMSVTEIDEDEFIHGKALRVTIFLSVFNVHINRIPISGSVTYHQYRPGKMLPAFKSHVSEVNERNTIGIDNGNVKILVHQITGFIARRIVWWVKPGDIVKQGQRYGLIKFGSCTELVVPKDQVKILVQQGDKVVGCQTVIGRMIH